MAEAIEGVTANAESPMDEQLRGLLSRLQEALQDSRELPRDLEDVLRQLNGKRLGPQSWDELLADVTLLCDGQLAIDLLIALREFENQDALRIMEAQRDPGAWKWLRRLMALYGRRVREAWDVGGERPEDWASMQMQVVLDVLMDRMMINVRVLKYSGEEVSVETGLSGALSFAANLLKALNAVPKERCARELAPKVWGDFKQKSSELVEHVEAELRYGLTVDLSERLREKGVEDGATLLAALDRHPDLKRDFDGELLRMFVETDETESALATFWNRVPEEYEAQFTAMVEGAIAAAQEKKEEERAGALQNRVRILRRIQGEPANA